MINTYAPNRERDRRSFFEEMEKYLLCDKLVVLLGDFNCVCAPEDRANKQPIRDKSAIFLSAIVQEHKLDDVASLFSDNNIPQFTHFQGNSHARLDRAFISTALNCALVHQLHGESCFFQ